MAQIQRTFGVAGEIAFTLGVEPVSDPTVSWFSNVGRSLDEVELTVTGSGLDWTAAWTDEQAPEARTLRFLLFTIETSAGEFTENRDDVILFTPVDVETGSSEVSPTAPDVPEGFVTKLGKRLRKNLTSAGEDRDAALEALADAIALVESLGVIPSPTPHVIATVILAVARRGFENPDGKSAETIGAYSYSISSTSPGVYLTDDEAETVRRAIRRYGQPIEQSRRLRARLGRSVLHSRTGFMVGEPVPSQWDWDDVEYNEFGQQIS